MHAYTKDELISSTEIVRNFSAILDSIKEHRRDKVAVMRKNKLEAVILSIDEYERIQELADLIEHLQIFKTIEKRKATPVEAYVDFEQVLAEHGLSIDDEKVLIQIIAVGKREGMEVYQKAATRLQKIERQDL